VTLLRNIGQLATCRPGGGQGELHLIPRAAVAWVADTIRWVGPEAELPAEYARGDSLDAGGRLVVPGLVDCHTHLAFGGWRADEFEQRLRGVGYLDIARRRGGRHAHAPEADTFACSVRMKAASDFTDW
jgi:imidazolonepropionase